MTAGRVPVGPGGHLGPGPAGACPPTSAGDRLWRLAPIGLLAALAAAVTLRDPHVPGAWGVCPTWGLLGVSCPGCGSLRALHDLMRGDVAGSVGHNALLLPAIAFVLVAAVRTPGARWSRIWLVALVAFTLARNIPGSPLAP